MGLCQSNEISNQKAISKKIDRSLNVSKKQVIQKMLLLGILIYLFIKLYIIIY